MEDVIHATHEDDEQIEVQPDDLPKYVEVRQHPPGKFSGYQHKWLDKTRGIIKSVGQWKKTGAEVVQKLLFLRDKGWTEDAVKSWFDDHPEFRAPDDTISGLFFAMSDGDATQLFSESFVMESLPIANFAQADTVKAIAIRGGWGKNRRKGPDGNLYRDYFPVEFLQSLVPLLTGAGVQAVKVKPPSDVSQDEIPAVIRTLVQELQQYGHPSETVNMLLSQGLAGNTIGLFKQAHVEYPEPGAMTHGELMTEPYVMTEIALTDTDHAMHTRKLFDTAWKHGLHNSLGLSINYKANVVFTQHDGQPACVFQTCTKFVSCEFVINPGAGGKIVLGTTQGDIMKDDLKAKDPVQADETEQDVPTATEEVSATQQDTAQDDAPTEDQKQTQERKPADVKPPQREDQDTPQPLASTQMIHDALKQAMPSMADDLKKLLIPEVIQAAQSTVSEAFKAANTARTLRENMVAAVTQSELSESAQSKILSGISAGKYQSMDVVQEIIEVAKANMSSVQGAPVFPGMTGHARVGAERKDYTKIRSKLMWDLPLTQAEQKLKDEYKIDRFMGLQHEYRELTGDGDITLHYDPNYFAQQVHPEMVNHRGIELANGSFSQAVITTTYADLLTHILDQSLRNHYEMQRKDWTKLAYKGEPYSDNRTHDEFLLGAFPEIDVVTENSSYTEIEYGHVEKMQSTSEKRGNLFSVTEEALQDDRLGYIKKALRQLSISVNRTMEHKVIKKVIGYGTAFNNVAVGDTIGGTGLYNATTRSNYVNGSIEELDKIVELVNLMLTQVDYMDDGGNEAPLILYPWVFVGNITKIGVARSRVKAEYEPGRDDMFPSTLNMKQIPDENFVGVHPTFLHGHQDDFLGVIPDPNQFPGMELQYFRGQETPEFQWEGNQQPAYGSLFSSDRLQLRVKFKHRLFYSQPKAFYALFQSA